MGVHTKLGLLRGFLYMLRPHVLVGIVMMVVAILMIAGGSICCLVFLALWISSLTGASSGKRVVLTRSSSSMRHEDEPLSRPSEEAGSDDDDLSGEACEPGMEEVHGDVGHSHLACVLTNSILLPMHRCSTAARQR